MSTRHGPAPGGNGEASTAESGQDRSVSPRRWLIRKIEPNALSPLDEQLWPIYAALFVLGAFLIGVLGSAGSFREPNPLRNPATGIALVVLGAVWAGWLIQRTSPQRVRRVTWFASVSSLLLHAILVLAMTAIGIFSRPVPPANSITRQPTPPADVVIPEYGLPTIQPDELVENQFDQPVAAELAENADRETAVRPDTAALAEIERAAAMERPQDWPHRPVAQRQAESDPSTAELSAPRALDRRTAAVPPPTAVQVSQDFAESTPAAVETNPQAIAVHEISRQDHATSPDLAASVSAVTPWRPEWDRTSAMPARVTSPEGLALSPPVKLPNRQARPEPPTRNWTADLPDTARGEDSADDKMMARTPSATPRQHGGSSDLTRPERQLDASPSTIPTTAMARSELVTVPTLAPKQQAAIRPRRALRIAESPAAPRDIAAPVVTDEHREQDSTAEPSAAALTQASDGTAGMGRDSGFGHQEAGALQPATLALNSAVRRASQSMEAGMALSPSVPTPIPRRRMDQAEPAAQVIPLPLAQASSTGESQPADRVADAGAIRQRSAADALPDTMTAPEGMSDFDTGVPQMASDQQLPRAAGGGRPDLNFQPPNRNPERRTRLPSPSTSLLADQPSARPVAELGTGGGTVPQPAIVAGAAPIQRAQSGPTELDRPPADGPREHVGSLALAPRANLPRRTEGASSVPDQVLEAAADSRPVSRAARVSAPYRATVQAEIAQPAGEPAAVPLEPRPQPATVGSSRPQTPTAMVLAPALAIAEPPSGAGPGPIPATVGTVPRHVSPDWQAQPAATIKAEVPLAIGRSLPTHRPWPTTSAVIAAPAYADRRMRRLAAIGDGRSTPIPKTEIAVEHGLRFLARVQNPDGRWSLHSWGEGLPDVSREIPTLRSDSAATGLALLAFLGAGYHHQADGYRDVVARGLEFLLRNQSDHGDLFVPEDELSNRSVALYSHAIATLALAEAYGMTQDVALREPTTRALRFIADSQHPQWGGWRYSPGISADTSVSGWMLLALRGGELSGIAVPAKTYEGIDRWLDAAQESDEIPYRFRYNPFAPDTESQRHGREPTPTMTSVGLLMRLMRSDDRSAPMLHRGADYLLQHLPARGTRRSQQRDTYYWYYATQFMFYIGGDPWRKWNARLHPLLIGEQVEQGDLAGSWDPLWPVPDRWGPQAGRLYVTAMNLLSLEVTYRHLPLYSGHGQYAASQSP